MTDETRKNEGQETKGELTDKDLATASGGLIIHRRPSTKQNEGPEKRRD